MAKDPEFLILKPTVGWLPESEWENLLGAAIKNPWSPTDCLTPNTPLSYNHNGLVQTQFEGSVLREEEVTSSSFEVEVKGLGKLHWPKSAGNKLDLKGKVVYVKRLRQHEQFWKEVTTKNDDFEYTVAGWVTDKHWGRAKYQVCLVVGLLMCQDVVVTVSDEVVRDRIKRGEIPLGAITEIAAASQGAPISMGGKGNISAEASAKVVNKPYYKASGKETQVFALELRIISSKKGKLRLTDDTPKAPQHRQLGGEDKDEDEVDPEDLQTCEVSPEDWAELLQE